MEQLNSKKYVVPMLIALGLSIVLNVELSLALRVKASDVVTEREKAEQWRSKASQAYAEAFLKKYSVDGKILLPKGSMFSCKSETVGNDKAAFKCNDFSVLPPNDY
jgi:hypothetical protein